ncbi:MAG: hypothetical protein F6K48_02945 [Okeania sp. SIO3H1]|nr:hypothetical protein [Okeania sp. SIO3H1]
MNIPVMSYAAAHKWETMAAARKVSVVARSSRGFMRAYQRAGSWAALDPWWKNRRNNFVKRHMAQVKNNDEVLWKKNKRTGQWTPSRRALALIMWAYMPPNKPAGAKPTMNNPYFRRPKKMSDRKKRALGELVPIKAPAKKSAESVLRERLIKSTKFKKKDGSPDLSKINWFIGKLRKEGKL